MSDQRDDAEDAKEFKLAMIDALEGSAPGQFWVGHCYDLGMGVDEDERQAEYWYRKAAENGDCEAQYHLAQLYDRNKVGLGTETEILHWFEKASDQGNLDATTELMERADMEGDWEISLRWHRRAVEQGADNLDYDIAYLEHSIEQEQKEKAASERYQKLYLTGGAQKSREADIHLPTLNIAGTIKVECWGSSGSVKPVGQEIFLGGQSNADADDFHLPIYVEQDLHIFESLTNTESVESIRIDLIDRAEWPSSGLKTVQSGNAIGNNGFLQIEVVYPDVPTQFFSIAIRGGLNHYPVMATINGGGMLYRVEVPLTANQISERLIDVEFDEGFEASTGRDKGGLPETDSPSLTDEIQPFDIKDADEQIDESSGEHVTDSEYSAPPKTLIGLLINEYRRRKRITAHHRSESRLLAAAEAGDPEAQYDIGYRYVPGEDEDFEPDYENAMLWWEKSAEGGDEKAQWNVAIGYLRGEGVPVDLEKWFYWAEKAANNDVEAAQHALGLAYQEGHVVEPNDELSFSWYKKAADQGHGTSIIKVANAYSYGRGVEKDLALAAEWNRKGAELGEPICMSNLGNAYRFGRGVEKDEAKAFELISKVADQYPNVKRWLALMYEGGQGVEVDLGKAAVLMEEAATDGSVSAQRVLGRYYLSGIGVEKDSSQAMYWWECAADADDILAHRSLGLAYYKGEIAEQDYEKAAYHFSEAADSSPFARGVLGLMFLKGQGVEKDVEWSLELHEQAANDGDKKSVERLADIYYRGEYVDTDYERAFFWATQGAENGSTDCQFKLGKMYFYGQGLGEDEHEAKLWFEKATEGGSNRSRCFLGMMYSEGIGVEKDMEKAFELVKESAENGDSVSQLNLGRLYDALDEPTDEDYGEAVKWLLRAADQGLSDAKYFLGTHYLFGTGVSQDSDVGVQFWQEAANEGYVHAQKQLGSMYEEGKVFGLDFVQPDIEEAIRWYRLAADAGDDGAARKVDELDRSQT